MADFILTPVRVEDATAIVDLVRESFDAARAPFLAYARPGMAAHLAVAIKYPGATPGRVLVAAREVDGGRLLGFADFRILEGNVGFLSYVAVSSDARGKGIATALIADFLHSRPHVTTMKLDVFRDNEPARRLYARMGFVAETTSAWATRPIPRGGADLRIRDLPSSLAVYDAYGFCELVVELTDGPTPVGLLGPSVLNARSLPSFLDDELLAGLGEMFPDLTTAFVALPESALQEITVHYRLQGLSDRLSLAVPGRIAQGSAS